MLLYQKRIVNVNVNIVVAGALALIPTAFAARWAERVFGHGRPLAITATTAIADAVADVLVYYVLHWLANHMPSSKRRANGSLAYAQLPYLKDATLVQFERMCLSPLLYCIALVTQYVLMRFWSVGSVSATIVGFGSAILVTRVIHTAWMLRTEHLASRKAHAAGQGS